jgi:hypothetical protein
VSAAALLAELAAAGITLTRHGDRLHYQTRPGVRIAPYRERIIESKPALLEALGEREAGASGRRNSSVPAGAAMDSERTAQLSPREVGALGLDPTLAWAHVSRRPVAATRPPVVWEGTAPAGCGAPLVCGLLGPCDHFNKHDRCWTDAEQP